MSYFPPEEYFDHSRIDFADSAPAWLEPLALASRRGAVVDALPARRPPSEGEDHPLGRPHRISAVLVLFSGDPAAPGPRPPNDAKVLLTHRAATLGSHAGQISFPGGGAEEVDVTIADTALREAREETGLDPESVDVLAVTGPLYIPVSNYSVYPVLGYWREPGVVGVADEAETSQVLDVPLSELLDPAQRFTVRQSAGWQGPAFSIGELVLWGFTAGVFAAASEVAGWDLPWDDGDVRDLEAVLEASANGEENSWPSLEIRAELEHKAAARRR
ncbi:NUDIX hydrolase [Dietzia sp.]|uniref:NUDIX hydrolase n=1 Tax=Dietzia sp. TaxID=1871616 RepID=UPI002FD8CF0E